LKGTFINFQGNKKNGASFEGKYGVYQPGGRVVYVEDSL
jgi:hypothetical protein